MTSRTPGRRLAIVLVAALVVASGGCAGDDGGSSAEDDPASDGPAPSEEAEATDPSATPTGPIVLNGQGNNLDAYATAPSDDGTFATQRVLTTVADDPGGRDINAQICVVEGDDGARWMIAGEDTGQDDPSRPAGWGIFEVSGAEVGDLVATQIGKLVPTYQPSNDDPENYGCGVLSDGRVVTTDVGNQASGDGDGQLIVWFPPLTGGTEDDWADVAFCKLDVALPTAQSILVVDDEVLVAAARGDVYRYPGPLPTSANAAGGCDGTDATGAPMATDVRREVFVEAGADGMATPSGLAVAPDDGVFVSSVFTGVINEYGPDGAFRRTVLAPPEGEALGPDPYSTGTPLGIATTPDGTLFYADIGIVVDEGGVGPGDGTGSVRRITFEGGQAQPPEVVAEGLAFPDGIGVLVP